MLKTRRLFQNIQRAAILLNRVQLRQKTHCMDHATIPAPLMGPQTIIIKSPYSVKVEAIDPVQFGHIKAVVGFLYLETETTEELSPKVKTAFQQDIQYNVRAVMSPSRDYMEVRTEKGSRTFGALQKYNVAFMNCVDEVGHSKVVGNMQIIQALKPCFSHNFGQKKLSSFKITLFKALAIIMLCVLYCNKSAFVNVKKTMFNPLDSLE